MSFASLRSIYLYNIVHRLLFENGPSRLDLFLNRKEIKHLHPTKLKILMNSKEYLDCINISYEENTPQNDPEKQADTILIHL